VPEFLWIGCSDSRVPANEIIGLPPGEVFVHRNVGNLVSLTDFNCLSVVQYAVQVLKIRHIIVCGHYGCGGVETALGGQELGIVNNWLSPINDIRSFHRSALDGLPSHAVRADKVCELNVIQQVRTLCRSAMLRAAWQQDQKLAVHGLIYGLEDGILHDLNATVSQNGESEETCHDAVARILAAPGRVVD
jgi:carbonic anhydrase